VTDLLVAAKDEGHGMGKTGGMKQSSPYTLKEAAQMLGLSVQTVTRLFEKERGIIVLERKAAGRTRKSYRTIRIPRPVFERVCTRLIK
jgi:predicted ArsR family transcriptional regulator